VRGLVVCSGHVVRRNEVIGRDHGTALWQWDRVAISCRLPSPGAARVLLTQVRVRQTSTLSNLVPKFVRWHLCYTSCGTGFLYDRLALGHWVPSHATAGCAGRCSRVPFVLHECEPLPDRATVPGARSASKRWHGPSTAAVPTEIHVATFCSCCPHARGLIGRGVSKVVG
jgi:hypothetical protein